VLKTARLGAVVCLLAPIEGRGEGRDVTEISLDDLLNAPVTVASETAIGARETPGVVTVISREEIRDSGARDLIDVLMLVPGFSPPAIDVEGVLDMGFRGIWGHEGKILLMVDGEPMNEMLYDDNALGFHYPVDSIQSVEIIRGPGSAIYGGWAELAVVNIITRGAGDLNGVSATAFYSQRLAPSALGQRSLNVEAGDQDLFGVGGLELSVSAFVGQGTRSNGSYSDFVGNGYGLSDRASNGPYNAELDPFFLNFAARYKDLKVRVIVDDYRSTERDSYGTDTGAATGVAPLLKFYTLIADASYDLHLGQLTISPRFTYKYQLPWQLQDQSVTDYFDTTVNRYTARLTATYAFSDALSVTAGTDDYVEQAWFSHPEIAANGLSGSQNYLPGGCPGGTPGNCATQVSYSNLAFLAEGQYRSRWGNLTLGGRYEHQSEYGDSFVPRAAYTKTWDKLNLKLLYSFAFRAPGIEDIALSPAGSPVVPERTRVAEAEIGYQFNEHAYASVNLFDISVQNPIVYYYDPASATQSYVNFPRTGSQGLEVDARLRYPWGYFYANYSYYSAWSVFAQAAKNDVPIYEIPGVNDQLIAMPAHKLTLRGKVAIFDRFSFDPTVIWFSQRWGVQSVDANGNALISQTGAVLLINAFVNVRDVGTQGLDLGLGVYNLFNSQWSYLQAYNSSHAPIPAPGAEVALRLSYTLSRPER
jgi:outer membrane receptor protein involved in Fe transport